MPAWPMFSARRAHTVTSMTATFAARDVRVNFGKFESVRGATLVAKPGRVTALLGPNGAGKSTTLRAALGLVRASGDLQVQGSIGLMLDDGGLIPGLTGRQHLHALALAKGLPVATISPILQQVGMADRCDRRIKTYSLGMKRRIALAGTLLGAPDILVLDEPTSGLDPAGIRWFQTLMREQAAQGKTVIVATHHLGEAAAIADDITIIADGHTRYSSPLHEITDLESTYFAHVAPGANR